MRALAAHEVGDRFAAALCWVSDAAVLFGKFPMWCGNADRCGDYERTGSR